VPTQAPYLPSGTLSIDGVWSDPLENREPDLTPLIAHELGHLELHRKMITSNVHVDKDFPAALMRDPKSATGSEQVEIEANQFAAELLMPIALIEQALAGKQFDIDDDGPIEDLAKKFRVSKQALEYRIRNRG
jgi:Zn-dependent peptidase ImmA (M78 family)